MNAGATGNESTALAVFGGDELYSFLGNLPIRSSAKRHEQKIQNRWPAADFTNRFRHRVAFYTPAKCTTSSEIIQAYNFIIQKIQAAIELGISHIGACSS
jgi:hypothetical protein